MSQRFSGFSNKIRYVSLLHGVYAMECETMTCMHLLFGLIHSYSNKCGRSVLNDQIVFRHIGTRSRSLVIVSVHRDDEDFPTYFVRVALLFQIYSLLTMSNLIQGSLIICRGLGLHCYLTACPFLITYVCCVLIDFFNFCNPKRKTWFKKGCRHHPTQLFYPHFSAFY